MGIAHGVRDRFQVGGGLVIGERPPGESIAQALSFDIAHGVEMPTADLSHLVHGHDVIVIQAGGGPGFRLEATDDLAPLVVRQIVEQFGLDELQRDDSADAELFGAIDDPHTTPADPIQQLVVAQDFRVVGFIDDPSVDIDPALTTSTSGFGRPRPRALRRGDFGEHGGDQVSIFGETGDIFPRRRPHFEATPQVEVQLEQFAKQHPPLRSRREIHVFFDARIPAAPPRVLVSVAE